MTIFSSFKFRLISCRFFTAFQVRKLATIRKSILSQYEEAISTLNSLQTNQSVLASNKRRGKSMNDILRYLSYLNVQLDEIDQLNIIHVAGTKGKGSTCAFTESILRQYGYKTGFYSSPHLVEVRERIRINGELISKEKFVHYFWQCYNPIRDAVQQSNDEDSLPMPFYFSFLTTMMFYVFIHERLDVAIVEVGIGGERDSTNIIKTPVVCGIASLGLDHVSILGNTIDKIAWQKSGIFKKGVPAVTVPQVPEAMDVLVQRAEEKGSTLTLTPLLNHYQNYPFHLGLNGEVQETNAALAIQLAFHWLNARGDQSYDNLMNAPLSTEVLQGLATCRWPGRNQIIETKNATYYLDGAHTIESIDQCKNWFMSCISKQETSTGNILLFYCSNEREPETLLQPLITCKFDSIAFCSPTTSLPLSSNDNNPQTDSSKARNDQWRATKNMKDEIDRLSLHVTAFEKLWLSTIENQTNMPSIHCFHTVTQAVAWIDESKLSKPSVLVTGSLYLVGALLKSFEEHRSEM